MNEDSKELGEWCLGLPWMSERELRTEERAELQKIASAGRRGCYAWGCGTPMFLLLALWVMLGVNEIAGKSGASTPIGIAVLIGVIIVPAFAFLKANDAGGAAKNARRDLIANRVVRYGNADNQIEVLSASRLVWRLNGECVSEIVVAPVSRLAEPPASAHTAALWTPPTQLDANGSLDASALHRRELTEQERGEMRKHGKSWKRPFAFALILTSLFIVLPAVMWLLKFPLQWETHAWFWLCLTLWCDFKFFQAAKFCAHIRADASNGFVFILRRPQPRESPDSEESDWDIPGEIAEVLPLTGATWTINGQPALWRND